jgi:hypothetical protein
VAGRAGHEGAVGKKVWLSKDHTLRRASTDYSGAGFKMGTVQAYLETYGYSCKRLGSDISCCRDINCEKATKDQSVQYSPLQESIELSDGKLVKFCPSNKWSRTGISCEARVSFLVSRYQLSQHDAKVSILENNCMCIEDRMQSNHQQPMSSPEESEDLAAASTDKEKLLFTDHGHDTADITEKVTNFCGKCMWKDVISCDSMVGSLMKESSISREQAIQAVLPECSINHYSSKCSNVYRTVAVIFVVIMAGIFCHKNCGVGTTHKSLSKPFIILVCVTMLCYSQLQFMCVLNNPTDSSHGQKSKITMKEGNNP